jgi:hypothetical protein
MKRLIILSVILFISILGLFSQINIVPSTDPVQLVNGFVLSGVSTSNIQYTGSLVETTNTVCTLGTFTNGSSTNLGINDGIIISTGNINQISNASTFFLSTSQGGSGNLILESIVLTGTHDAGVLEFDLIPVGNILEFEYVFASEEYPEYVCSAYNDIFGFFISGPDPLGGVYSNTNIAIIPGTNLPVSINTVNQGVPGGMGLITNCISLSNSIYYINNPTGGGICFDGFTTVLTAHADVMPGESYHLVMAVADVSDCIFDSGIFLKAHSMKSYNSTTGIFANNNENYSVAYNPQNTQLIVNKKDINSTNDIISVYNIQGQKIMEENLIDQANTIDFSSFQRGIYIIKVNGGNSSTVSRICR